MSTAEILPYTFGELKTDLEGWCQRDDVSVGNVFFPSIVRAAGAALRRDIHMAVSHAVFEVSAFNDFLSIPTAAWAIRSVNVVGNADSLTYLTPEAFAVKKSRGGSGEPTHYTLGPYNQVVSNAGDYQIPQNPHITIFPAASLTNIVPFEVHYYTQFNQLTDDADTNPMLEEHFDAVLYQFMHQIGLYLHDDALADKYARKYDQTRQEIARYENRKRYRGNVLKTDRSQGTII